METTTEPRRWGLDHKLTDPALPARPEADGLRARTKCSVAVVSRDGAWWGENRGRPYRVAVAAPDAPGTCKRCGGDWKLTKARCEEIVRSRRPGRYCDTDGKHGLSLVVTKTGGASWVQRLVVRGKRRDRGLGSYRRLTISKARKTAARNWDAARDGRDPWPGRGRTAAKDGKTFGEVAERWIDGRVGQWRPATVKAHRATLRNHLGDFLKLDIRRITRQDAINHLRSLIADAEGKAEEKVKKAVTAVEKKAAEKAQKAVAVAARKAVKVMRAVVEVAIGEGLVEASFCNGGVAAAIPALAKAAPAEHHGAMPHADVPAWYRALPWTAAGACLRMICLTALRASEARGLRWSDIRGDVLVIPEERMKAKKEHRVPLSPAALKVLERRRGTHGELVFASDRTARQMSPMFAARMMPEGSTTHGLRSTLADWATEAGYAVHVVKGALAHAVGSTTMRSYVRTDDLDNRRALLEAWAEHVTGGRG